MSATCEQVKHQSNSGDAKILCGEPAVQHTLAFGYRCHRHQVSVNPEDPPNAKNDELHNANSRQVGGEHYRAGTPIQPWDFIVANDIPFLEGCAIKHISRHRLKNGREDLEKAIHYLQKAIEVYYPDRKDPKK